jgi:cytochrome c oxidase cbb3-type subunit 4
MSYHDLAEFARSWGLVYLVGVFAAAVAYALWPANRGKFERAARLPLEEE